MKPVSGLTAAGAERQAVSETCLIAGWRDSELNQYTGLLLITLSNVMASH